MDRFNAINAFCRVVETGSFSAAAADINVSHTVMSKQVRQLESLLGTQLLNRTTRRLALTEAGQAYYQHARRSLDELEAAQHAVTQHQAVPGGMLRINAPMAFGTLDVAHWLPRFLALYPALKIDLVCNDRYVDLIEEGFDVGLRLARDMPDSTMMARKLADSPTLLVAAPSYLARHGMPAAPQELSRHNCLAYTLSPRPGEWSFRTPDGGRETVPVRGNLQANTGMALRAAALAGTGIIAAASFIVQDDLAAGRLVSLLPDYPLGARSLYAVYPHNRHLSPKVRAFIDFACDLYGTPRRA